MSHIETMDTEGKLIRILTNDFQREAEEMGEIYAGEWEALDSVEYEPVII